MDPVQLFRSDPPLAIPAAQIAATRRAFPGSPLSYELDLRAGDPWAGIAECSAALQAAGLRLKLMRCTAEGLITLRVEDPGAADLGALCEAFSHPPALSLQRWVTQVGDSPS